MKDWTKEPLSSWSGSFDLSKAVLLTRDDDPQDKVDQNPRYTTWNERDDHRKAEPERTDSEKLGQPAADASKDAVAF